MRHTPTLIIGSGFSGSSVASKLKAGSYTIIDRGEQINLAKIREKFDAMPNDPAMRHHHMVRTAYTSKHSFNIPDKIAPQCASDYILVGGGCSNHWGGLSLRLSPEVFDRHGTGHDWPFTYQSLVPYYRAAEQLLNICYDKKDPYQRNGTAIIKGCDYWHQLLEPHFSQAYVGAQAHNLNIEVENDQGFCAGTGDCELCPFDAKARSETVFRDRNMQYDTLCREIVFDNERAIYANCYSPKEGEFKFYFDRIVVAAHGVESPKLLWRSSLPKAVNIDNIGSFYQDHAVAEIYGVLRKPIKYWHMNTHAQILIPELSGEVDGVEYTALGIVSAPHDNAFRAALNINDLSRGRARSSMERVSCVMGFYILLDIPPEWNLKLRYVEGKAALDSTTYYSHIHIYERIMEVIRRRLKQCDVELLDSVSNLHYKKHFGTHHLVGTLNMSKGDNGVVDKDFLLKGTTNVYIAGTSLFPRCGSRNPTVTATALGLKLGTSLVKNC